LVTRDTSSGRKVKYGGVNIAGFEFSVDTSGNRNVNGAQDISVNGTLQMQHFVTDLGLNAFRLPVAWQYLVNNVLGGPLDPAACAKYDKLVQGCLSSGAALCIVDVHNYARWNGGIVGQGGPTNDQFALIWAQLAGKYGAEPRIAFDIINEPHNLNITLWAATNNAVVAAIRKTVSSNMILLSGMDFASAGAFPKNSGPAMLGVKNPDGSTTGLIFNVHQYLDADYSGTNPECTYNNVDAFNYLAKWLRTNNRQAFVTETGGGNTASCATLLCQELDAINANSDVFVGVTVWSAGAFSSTYMLSTVPVKQAGVWKDQSLVNACVKPKLGTQ
jgi:endoglucanase